MRGKPSEIMVPARLLFVDLLSARPDTANWNRARLVKFLDAATVRKMAGSLVPHIGSARERPKTLGQQLRRLAGIAADQAALLDKEARRGSPTRSLEAAKEQLRQNQLAHAATFYRQHTNRYPSLAPLLLAIAAGAERLADMRGPPMPLEVDLFEETSPPKSDSHSIERMEPQTHETEAQRVQREFNNAFAQAGTVARVDAGEAYRVLEAIRVDEFQDVETAGPDDDLPPPPLPANVSPEALESMAMAFLEGATDASTQAEDWLGSESDRMKLDATLFDFAERTFHLAARARRRQEWLSRP
jgi:hypothetical protein